MIHLYYWPTPNGKKVTILLEELGMPYAIVPSAIPSFFRGAKMQLEVDASLRRLSHDES